MATTSLAPNRPEDLPIWARLNLMKQAVAFEDVTTWNNETPTRIIAYLDNGFAYVYLYKR